MITLRAQGGRPALTGEPDSDVYAYLDAEWANGLDGAELPVVRVPRTGSGEPDEIARDAFAALARRAVEAVAAVDPAAVAVTGNGLVALEARRLLGAPAEVATAKPAAVIDTTGDPAVIADATERLETGGMIVLAGESVGRRADMNLYPDVHVRGLRLLGVGSGSDPEPRGAAGGPAGDVPPPAQVELGEPLPEAAWYRVR